MKRCKAKYGKYRCIFLPSHEHNSYAPVQLPHMQYVPATKIPHEPNNVIIRQWLWFWTRKYVILMWGLGITGSQLLRLSPCETEVE